MSEVVNIARVREQRLEAIADWALNYGDRRAFDALREQARKVRERAFDAQWAQFVASNPSVQRLVVEARREAHRGGYCNRDTCPSRHRRRRDERTTP